MQIVVLVGENENAVDEWLVSGKTAHLLRDCHNHGYTIMAGMFGINNKLFHEKYGLMDLR